MTHITLAAHPAEQRHGALTRAAVAEGIEEYLPTIIGIHKATSLSAEWVLLPGQAGEPGVEAHHPECWLRIEGNPATDKVLKVAVHPLRLNTGCGNNEWTCDPEFVPTVMPEYFVYLTPNPSVSDV